MEARVRGSGVFVSNILHLPALLITALAVNIHPNPLPQPGDVFIPEKKGSEIVLFVTIKRSPSTVRPTMRDKPDYGGG